MISYLSCHIILSCVFWLVGWCFPLSWLLPLLCPFLHFQSWPFWRTLWTFLLPHAPRKLAVATGSVSAMASLRSYIADPFSELQYHACNFLLHVSTWLDHPYIRLFMSTRKPLNPTLLPPHNSRPQALPSSVLGMPILQLAQAQTLRFILGILLFLTSLNQSTSYS